jgi:Cu2+-exporting ATPase
MLPWVIVVARAVRAAILTNLMWAFGYDLLAVGLALVGLLQPVLAAAVMAGSSIVVVLNSLRLERLPEPIPPPQPGHGSHAEAEITPALRTSGIAVVAGQALPGG